MNVGRANIQSLICIFSYSSPVRWVSLSSSFSGDKTGTEIFFKTVPNLSSMTSETEILPHAPNIYLSKKRPKKKKQKKKTKPKNKNPGQ